MPYLVLGIAIVVGIVLMARGFSGMDPRRVLFVLRWIALATVGGVVLFFTIERGIAATVGVAAFLLPVLLRWRGIVRWMRNLGGPSPGQSSGVETPYLRMSLDHDTGALGGTVLAGRFRGRRLAELGRSELIELWRECRVEHEPSATILEAYLDRTQGSGWRNADEAGARSGAETGGRSTGGAMTPEEAYEILGLKPGAPEQAIKAAHRKLMLKLHPDQGGSDYLAAKINQAKDLLMRRRR